MINQPPPRRPMTPFLSMCVLDVADGTASLYVLTMMMMAIIIRFNDKQNMSLVVCFWMKKTTDKYELPLEIKKTKEKQKNKKMGKENQLSSVPTAGCCCRSTCLSIYLGYIPASRVSHFSFSLSPNHHRGPTFYWKHTTFAFNPLILSSSLVAAFLFSSSIHSLLFYSSFQMGKNVSLSCYVSLVFPFFQYLSVRQAR